MILTASRSVVLLTFGILAATVVVWLGQQGFRRRDVWLGGVLTVLLVLGLLEIGAGGVAQRIAYSGLMDQARLESYRSTAMIIADHPWFGIGLGNFEVTFPSYRSEALGSFGIWDRAHSTPLEMAAELGLPAALLVALAWLAAAAILLRAMRRNAHAEIYCLIALAVGLLGTLHSLVDFSLQIPGYAMTFAAIVACGLAQAESGAAVGPERRIAAEPRAARERGARVHVVVATPLGLGGRGGIDRIMDAVRRQAAHTSMPDLALSFVTTRGQAHIAASPFRLVFAMIRLVYLRAVGRADVLHVNLSSHGSTTRKIILCALARWLRLPYVVHLHGSRFREYYEASERRALAIDRMFSGAANILVLGDVWRRLIVGRVPEIFERIEILPNASFAPPAPASRRGAPVTILFLGRLGARKGTPQLVQAFARLADVPNWRGVIAGDGDLEATQAMVAASGVAGRVSLTGWVGDEDVNRLLAAADMLVLPSFNENLPMSVIEGMAYGLAVVATPVGAVPDILVNDVNGLLVAAGDVDGLAAALGRLVQDAALRRRLGDAAAAFHQSNLDIARYFDRLTTLWLAVASEGKRAG